MLSLVYAALTALDEKGNAVPAGSPSRWKYDDDGTAVTFTLRAGPEVQRRHRRSTRRREEEPSSAAAPRTGP